MDDCSRQDPAYRSAKEKPRQRGFSICVTARPSAQAELGAFPVGPTKLWMFYADFRIVHPGAPCPNGSGGCAGQDDDRAPICPYCGVTTMPADPSNVIDTRFECENPDCDAFGERL